MAIITESQLRQYGILNEYTERARQTRTSNRSAATATVFLSHSHQDRELVVGAVNFLANQGVRVYVDWLDPEMPEATNAATAARIKLAIGAHRKFIVLATERSLASRWVPWELGIADGSGKLPHTAILPVRRDNQSYSGNEYLDLYSRIIIADGGGAGVFPPNETNGIALAAWLAK